jgi:hypothetical protein
VHNPQPLPCRFRLLVTNMAFQAQKFVLVLRSEGHRDQVSADVFLSVPLMHSELSAHVRVQLQFAIFLRPVARPAGAALGPCLLLSALLFSRPRMPSTP